VEGGTNMRRNPVERDKKKKTGKGEEHEIIKTGKEVITRS